MPLVDRRLFDAKDLAPESSFTAYTNVVEENTPVVEHNFDTAEQLSTFLDTMGATRTAKILCEKRTTVDMNKLLIRVLDLVCSEPADAHAVNKLNTVLSGTENKHALATTFAYIRDNKIKSYDIIDVLDCYRLKTNLKGKKTPSLKKNVPCQTFESCEEADNVLAQTRHFFDLFLQDIEPSKIPIDVDSFTPLHPVDRTCFMVICKPRFVLCENQTATTETPPPSNKNCDVTYRKLDRKRKIYKIPHHFSIAMSDTPRTIYVSNLEYLIWLTSQWGAVSN